MGKLPFYIQDQRKVCLSTYNLIKSGRETIHQESTSPLTSRRLKNQSFAQLNVSGYHVPFLFLFTNGLLVFQ